jgi:hypothetical protein
VRKTQLSLVVVLVTFFATSAVSAQPPPGPSSSGSPTTASASPSPGEINVSAKGELTSQNQAEHPWLEQALTAAGSAAIVGLGIVVAALRNQRASLIKRLEKFFSPPQVAADETFSSSLVLGIGGSGKTTLVNRLTNDKAADPAKETETFRLSGVSFDLPAERPEKRCRMFFADYVGQNLGSLLRGFILEQRHGDSPLAYGYITSLILVVDLVEPPELAGEPTLPAAAICEERVTVNIASWNQQALSAVFGLLTNQLQLVCLFVNKVDAVQQPGQQVAQVAKSLYRPLHEELGKRSRGAKFILIVGSADEGTGVTELKDELIHSAISSKLLLQRTA